MKVNRSIRSPNFDPTNIDVQFVVIHYTACGLQSTFDIFRDPDRKASSHIVISNSGEVYEVVKCLDGQVQRAWHAGKSKWYESNKIWEGFNDFSLGIELVNNNGNLLAYNDKQYESLIKVIQHFKEHHPSLLSPSRILGHEHISGWRGKVDPGWMFDWKRLFIECYPEDDAPTREPSLPVELKNISEKFLLSLPSDEKARATFWQTLSSSLEISVALINNKQSK